MMAKNAVKQKTERQLYWEGFSSRLIETIEKKKMSKSDFAKQMKITPVTVTHWTKDGRVPNAFYLNKMCDVLKVSADYLLGRKKK
jgi:transcriptional regulator with XRE-family HTH domain